MSDDFRFFSSLILFSVAVSPLAAQPGKQAGKSEPKEVTLAEFGLTLTPPPGIVRNEDAEAELRRALPASVTSRATTFIFNSPPDIRDPLSGVVSFTVSGSKVDTTGMTPDRQLRLANPAAADVHFDTQTSDLKIAGAPAKRYQFQMKPLVGKPVKGVFDGGVSYYFCRPGTPGKEPGLMISVSTRGFFRSEKAWEQFLKDGDAAVATFKFTEK